MKHSSVKTVNLRDVLVCIQGSKDKGRGWMEYIALRRNPRDVEVCRSRRYESVVVIFLPDVSWKGACNFDRAPRQPRSKETSVDLFALDFLQLEVESHCLVCRTPPRSFSLKLRTSWSILSRYPHICFGWSCIRGQSRVPEGRRDSGQ